MLRQSDYRKQSMLKLKSPEEVQVAILQKQSKKASGLDGL